MKKLIDVLIIFSLIAQAFGINVYQTDFDSLTEGSTLPLPGRDGQDGWYNTITANHSYGEIQSGVANTGRALHELSDRHSLDGESTIDTRPVTDPDLYLNPIVTLTFDFYCSSSDYDNTNIYHAHINVTGGDEGLEVLSLHLSGGNGQAKSDTGVGVVLYSYSNDANNNVDIPLSVGQSLEWDTWHHLELIIDQASDKYVSLTVDGDTEDIGSYTLLRNGQDLYWYRGNEMDYLNVMIFSDQSVGDNVTTDDVYWDNLSLNAVPEPMTLSLFVFGFFGCLKYARPKWTGPTKTVSLL